ncbi:MAG: hypothetical protein WDN75_21450 [Bacteroidota bacterium]
MSEYPYSSTEVSLKTHISSPHHNKENTHHQIADERIQETIKLLKKNMTHAISFLLLSAD